MPSPKNSLRPLWLRWQKSPNRDEQSTDTFFKRLKVLDLESVLSTQLKTSALRSPIVWDVEDVGSNPAAGKSRQRQLSFGPIPAGAQ